MDTKLSVQEIKGGHWHVERYNRIKSVKASVNRNKSILIEESL